MAVTDTIKKYYESIKPSFPISGAKNYKDRELYYCLLNCEDYSQFLPCVWNNITKKLLLNAQIEKQIFNGVEQLIECCNSKRVSNFDENILKLLEKEQDDFDINLQKEEHIYLIRQHAPLCRIDGCWLSNLVSLRDSSHQYGALLLENHALISGNGKFENSSAYHYEKCASLFGIKFSPLYTRNFTFDEKIEEYSFILPCFLIAISFFPGLLLPEILGINLMVTLIQKVQHMNDILNFHFPGSKTLENAMDAIQYYARENPNERKIIINRISRGMVSTYALYSSFFETLKSAIEKDATFSVENKMVDLIRKLGENAYGYHKKGTIGGKPINEWLCPGNFCPKKTLDALANSKYIKPGQPDKSPFLTYIISPKGPMFRIFSEEEVKLIRQWVINLSNKKIKTDNFLVKYPLSKSFAEKHKNIVTQRSMKIDHRDLYYYLVNIDRYPSVYPTAKTYVHNHLYKYKIDLLNGNCIIPFKSYQHEKLDNWLYLQHKKQVNSYQPLIDKPIESKEEVIFSAIKLCPLTYIDGAWVRKMTMPAMLATEVGRLLYNIYIDELGNGNTALHHGNIYKNLMQTMDVLLPDFSSKEFPHNENFDKEDLEIPIYWLAISLFPKTFFPEILGLNLAMELSGIGGEYRRSGDILKHYGFSSQFTLIHNTIDNVVTGHTAWSLKAIKLFLDDAFQHGGRDAVQENWHRIWLGYRSLKPNRRKINHIASLLLRLSKKISGKNKIITQETL